MAGRKKDAEPLVRVSTLVPHKWLEIKSESGLTWRQLIAKGTNYERLKKESKDTEEYLFNRIDELTKEKTEMLSEIRKLKSENYEMQSSQQQPK